MFHSFTGNSRRPRQVNLSGRNNNPFASAQSSFNAKPPGGGNSALANAQLERKARQADRDRLVASKVIQRTWRGYRGRGSLRSQWRLLLEQSEAALSRKSSGERQLEEIKRHVRLCTHTVVPTAEDGWAVDRILNAGHWVYEKATDIVRSMSTEDKSGEWASVLRAYIRLVSSFLRLALPPGQSKAHTHSSAELYLAAAELEARNPNLKIQIQQSTVLFACIITILDTWPYVDWSSLKESSQSSTRSDRTLQGMLVLERFYYVLAQSSKLEWLDQGQDSIRSWTRLVVEVDTSEDVRNAAVSLVAAPVVSLRDVRSEQRLGRVYDCMVTGLFSAAEISETLLLAARSSIDPTLFYRQVYAFVTTSHGRMNLSMYQNLIASIVRMSQMRLGQNSQTSATPTNSMSSYSVDFLRVVSALLNLFTSTEELDTSTLSQLDSITNADTVAQLFRREFLHSSKQSNQRDADVLAEYILNVLRLFPSQAENIRMRLYMSHDYPHHGQNIIQRSAVRYFWEAASETLLFKRAVRGWSEVRGILRDSSDRRRTEWKVIVLFMEIYTMALRIQDDEHFVQGLSSGDPTTSFGFDTLVGIEVQMLLEFLKNVCYSLYLKAPPTDASDAVSGMNSGNSDATYAGSPETQSTSAVPRGINMQQLKISITALLRMLYERDSRRRFLPARSFLMLTDEIESQTFISTVIRETLIKQKLEDEDSDEDGEEGEEEDHDNQLDAADVTRERSSGVIRSQHIQRLERHTRRERQQMLDARRRTRKEAAPRVELLENIPFLVQFEKRVNLFRVYVDNDMTERRGGDPDPDRWRLGMHVRHDSRLAAHQAELRRESIFEDAFNAFDKLGEGLKEPIRISFAGEEGIDGGGVTKEFLTSIINDVFRVDSPYRLFVENDDHMLYPNPNVFEEADAELDEIAASGEFVSLEQRRERRKQIMLYYRFAGRLVGKCLYEGILVDVPLARFFVTKWALTGGDGAARHESTYRPSVNDMWNYDKAIFKSLLDLQNTKDDVSSWGITFAVDDTVAGKQVEHELIPGGSNVTVDKKNRIAYRFHLVNYYLQLRQRSQTKAFLDGLGSIIKPTWLRMFNEAEIRVLLGGESRPIDVEDLRRNTICSGVYEIGDDMLEHDTVRMFWEVMHEMDDSDRRKLLQYVTSTPNAPLMGFAHLNPRFSIRDSQSDQGRLPTSSTCANLLKLPIYRSKETLRERVMTAIHSGAGFDLS